MNDWLQLEDKSADWLAVETISPETVSVEETISPETVSVEETISPETGSTALIPAPQQVVKRDVPGDIVARNAAFKAAWDGLRERQRDFLISLRANNFNIAQTLRSYKGSGDTLCRETIYAWRTSDETFAFVLRVMKMVARDEVADPDQIHLRLDQIAEEALEPKEMTFKGMPTGIFEKNYTASLKATELQMKALKMTGEEKSESFGGRSITLAVQVVMPNGDVRDATRAGVVIDVPVVDVTDES